MNTHKDKGRVEKNDLCPICFHSKNSAAHKAAAHSLYNPHVDFYDLTTTSSKTNKMNISRKKKEGKMKPDEKTIKALIKGIKKYNHAKTAEEGFGALGGLIGIGIKELKKNEKET